MDLFGPDMATVEEVKLAEMSSQEANGTTACANPERREDTVGNARVEGKEANDMTCAICLDEIVVEDLCMVKGCDHVYCGKCILVWATQKDPCWCPQCKAPFTSLLTYRKLDGTLSEFPTEESVCLLKRTHWFEFYLKELEKGKAALNLAPIPLTADDARDWVDWQEESQDYRRYEEEFDDDEEVEAYYFSSAAGRARIIGNRRFGENGYISSGRMQARPVPPMRSHKGKGKAQSAAGASSAQGNTQHHASHRTVGGSASSSAAAAAASCDFGSPVPGRARGSSSDGTPGSSGSKQGRRARRKEKQASADARARLLASP